METKESVMAKIFLLGTALFLILIIFATIQIHHFFYDLNEGNNWESQVSLIERISSYTRQLQIERGRTMMFIENHYSPASLSGVFGETDKMYPELLKELKHFDFPRETIERNENLPHYLETARILSKGKSDPMKSFERYSELIFEVLLLDKTILGKQPLGELGPCCNTLFHLEFAKESVGKLRGFGSWVLSSGKPLTDELLLRMVDFYGRAFSRLDSPFLHLCGESSRIFIEERFAIPRRKLNEFLLEILKKSGEGNFNIDSNEFFKYSSLLIDEIERVISFEIAHSREIVAREKEGTIHRIYESLLGLFLLSMLFIFLAWRYFNSLISIQESDEKLNATLRELAVWNENEFLMGKQVQEILLSGEIPRGITGVEIAGMTLPAKNINGDFYEFYELNENCFDILFGDVMGKGLAAGLGGAAVKTRFHKIVFRLIEGTGKSRCYRLEDGLSELHKEMTPKLLDLERFVSLHLARCDLLAKEMEIINCGHTPIVHYRHDFGKCQVIEGTNMPLGLNEREKYSARKISFESGDIFIFYSDGIVDSRNSGGEFFSIFRLCELISPNRNCLPQEMIKIIFNGVTSFSSAAGNADDLTCVVIRIK